MEQQQYRIRGLSCANCAREMEEDIRKLPYGEDAKISYNSGKLTVNSLISVEQVEQILKRDGAKLEELEPASSIRLQTPNGQQNTHERTNLHSNEQTHDHDHSQQKGLQLPYLILLSAVLFGASAIAGDAFPSLLSISLYLIATVISGYTTFIKGFRNLIRFKFNIDTLMTIALIGAVAIGEWKEATLVAILFGVNEWLEGFGMDRARRSMEKLLQVAPKQATRIENGVPSIIPIAELQVGDIVLVRAGEKIPSDGTIVEGSSSVNEAAITGESLPVEKSIGERVFGGSINNEGVLKLRIDKAYQDSSLARILHLVEEAQETKTPTELFINRFSTYYTPAVIVIAIGVMLIPPLFLGGSWSEWLYEGLAVLIVGCPCALILSSPIAIVAGITRNARNGILVKGGVHLEQLGKLHMLAFDKTGTLTKGHPHVEDIVAYDEDQLFRVAAAVERTSSHPLAKAIMNYVQDKVTSLEEAQSIQTVAGQGVIAELDGFTYYVGNEKNISHLSIPALVEADIQRLKAAGLSLVIISDQQQILGIFGIADEIRPEARQVLNELHQVGIRRTIMLTGDHERTASKVAETVGVDEYYAELLPEDKVKQVQSFAAQGAIGMIGDGINDAPALASAHLGIAMGKGTDSAIETADVVLMQDHLGKLPEAIRISRQVNRMVRINIVIALGLKIVALLLTIPGWLTLWFAILSDMGATILVTLLSLTIFITKKRKAGV